MIWVQHIIEMHGERVCLIGPWVTADLISNSPFGIQNLIYSSQFGRTFTFSQTLSVLSQALLLLLLTFYRFLKNYQEVSGEKQDSLPGRYVFH